MFENFIIKYQCKGKKDSILPGIILRGCSARLLDPQRNASVIICSSITQLSIIRLNAKRLDANVGISTICLSMAHKILDVPANTPIKPMIPIKGIAKIVHAKVSHQHGHVLADKNFLSM